MKEISSYIRLLQHGGQKERKHAPFLKVRAKTNTTVSQVLPSPKKTGHLSEEKKLEGSGVEIHPKSASGQFFPDLVLYYFRIEEGCRPDLSRIESPTTDVEEGVVVQQLRKGYRLHERLVRPASVLVAKAPLAEPGETGS